MSETDIREEGTTKKYVLFGLPRIGSAVMMGLADFALFLLYAVGYGVPDFLVLFAFMWIGEVLEVVQTGDTSTGSYQSSPVTFWTIKCLDLGLTIPLGFIGMYLLLTRPKQAYPLLLLFFGQQVFLFHRLF